MIELKEGAIFISDAHTNINRTEFYEFLKKVERGELKPSQLIFMGDMFDLLIGGVGCLERFYEKEIKLINAISENIEIIYMEGNHDFNLKKLFPKVKVFSFFSQPVLASYRGQKVLLSHGDRFEKKSYVFVHAVFRNRLVLKVLNLINTVLLEKPFLSYLQKVQNKKICKNIENFKQIIKQKILLNDIGVSEIDFVLEGHYHQGVGFEFENTKYFNFASYSCDEQYYTLKGDKITFQ